MALQRLSAALVRFQNVTLAKWLGSQRTYYLEAYGVKSSNTVDSADIIQGLIDADPQATFVIPQEMAISKPIRYYARTHICGRDMDNSVVTLLPGFQGSSAFIPASYTQNAVQFAKLHDFLVTDASASNDGSGSTSTKNAVDVTGTFGVSITRVGGVRMNKVAHADPGPLGVHQYTKRTKLSELNASNTNWLIKFEPATDNRLAYGDIYLSNLKTTGSLRYGIAIEDTDGLTGENIVMFPSSQIKMSGHFLNLAVVHAFEPKAKLTEPANVSAETIVVTRRAGGQPSNYVNITGLASAMAGRLADTTIGNPAQVNKGANGISLYNVETFQLNGTINDAAMHGLYLEDCRNGSFNLSMRSVNTQRLGSGKLPVNTYDSVHMVGCQAVTGVVNDTSDSRRHVVYMDGNTRGCSVTGSAVFSTFTYAPYNIPSNGENYVSMLVEVERNKYTHVGSGVQEFRSLEAAPGDTAPSVTSQNMQVVDFSNSAVTMITDIPSVKNRQIVIVNIRDNNASRFVDESLGSGGKFKLKDPASPWMGRGKCGMFYREPVTGFLVEL